MNLLQTYLKLLKENTISKYKASITFNISIDKTKHADERQWRHGVDDMITDEDIISTAKKATNYISKMLLLDKLDLRDELVIYDRNTNLNLVCVLEEGRDADIAIVIITVMKKRDFKPKNGTIKITI